MSPEQVPVSKGKHPVIVWTWRDVDGDLRAWITESQLLPWSMKPFTIYVDGNDAGAFELISSAVDFIRGQVRKRLPYEVERWALKQSTS